MKYLIRSVKYFFYLLVILTLVLAGLVAFGVAEADVSKLFVNGYNSLWQIGVFLLVMSLIYPHFGFTTKPVHLAGSEEEVEPLVRKVMEERGYVLTSKEGGRMTYRKKGAVSRVLRICEDPIIFTRTVMGYDAEGLSRDLTRLVSAIEYQQQEL